MGNETVLNAIKNVSDIKNLNYNDLIKLCNELRSFIIRSVSRTGGHLASNLGVVELTVALHYILDSPKDKIIWDVGHQSYIHKILTGRKEDLSSIRQYNGLSGFPKRSESEHDIFETGHSSTSISAALGIARARDIKGLDYKVSAVIGDGALTGGMAFEALNDAGHSKTRMLVILNDNQMSITTNVGALSNYLSKIRSNKLYKRIKEDVWSVLDYIPYIGKPMGRGIEKFKNSLKYLVVRGVLFEELGFTYIGPVDGHDLPLLISTIDNASKINGPVFLHVVTKKGKGYSFAENSPEVFHSVSPFNIKTGKSISNNTISTYSKVLGSSLIEIAENNNKIVAISAAMPHGTGLIEFSKKFPKRFFDVGIAEQHAVTLAAGLSLDGMRPVLAIYSTFLQRAYDQIVHDVCLQNLPVIFAIDRAGITGKDGETHQGIFDISYLRHMPNIRIFAPANFCELKKILNYATTLDCPVAIRYPKGSVEGYKSQQIFNCNKWDEIFKPNIISVLSYGTMLKEIINALNELKNRYNINIGLINCRMIKPLDEEMLCSLSKKTKTLITIEDNVISGGFGSSINEFIMKEDLTMKVKNIGVPNIFVKHGSVNELYKDLKIDSNSLVDRIKVIYEEEKCLV